jgi:hypothetical protein
MTPPAQMLSVHVLYGHMYCDNVQNSSTGLYVINICTLWLFAMYCMMCSIAPLAHMCQYLYSLFICYAPYDVQHGSAGSNSICNFILL